LVLPLLRPAKSAAANARLIAAAPELLNALQRTIMEFWVEYEYPDRAPEQSPTVKEIRKAEHVIGKAKGEFMTNVLSEFNRLCQMRDLAAYRAVAAIQIVVDFFGGQDYQAALTQLQKARAEFQEAERRISEFHNSHEGDSARHDHHAS
jgi:hypothetical protein